MSMTSFDTLAAAKQLKAAGFDEPQAEAVVDAVSKAVTDAIATKSDVAEIRADFSTLRAEFATLKAELGSRFESLEHRMTIKLGGMIAAAAGFLVVIDKLL